MKSIIFFSTNGIQTVRLDKKRRTEDSIVLFAKEETFAKLSFQIESSEDSKVMKHKPVRTTLCDILNKILYSVILLKYVCTVAEAALLPFMHTKAC